MPKPTLAQGDSGLSLALAMVVASTAPLVLLDAEGRVTAASVSFCTAFDIDGGQTVGRRLTDLGDGEWNVRQLTMLMDATLSGDATIKAYEMELRRPGQPTRQLVLHLQKLITGAEPVRLLLAIADMTEMRNRAQLDQDTRSRNEELERDNALLLQEIQHRVANSLQIIASVMMQNARKTQSEETRVHLRDAHNRVMSVAELQKQLAVSTSGSVNLRLYLTKLCDTIGASMIDDPTRVSLVVKAADELVDPGVSVSLGLVVTELVINSLKHAFPGNRRGSILVSYAASGEDWTLAVEDDGVGMPPHETDVLAGLGTSIVQALARQLRAQVILSSAHPGARVAIDHVAAAEPAAEPDRSRPEPAV